MKFADGKDLQTDMIVFSAGIRPRDELARECGLAVGERGGIVIDDACRTSDADIYAIGECALWSSRLFGLVAPGYQMARPLPQRSLRARHRRPASRGADMSTKLKLLGVDVAPSATRMAPPPARAATRSSTSAARSTRSW